jgi:hypothetical protein
MSKTQYVMSRENLEETADFIKTVVVRALVENSNLIFEEADDWCKNHTVIMRKKNIFETLSDKFRKTEESSSSQHFIVVKRV